MNEGFVGRNVLILDSVPSTNNYIADHPDLHDLADGTAILALHQSAGRGQRGNVWQSVRGKDLTVSYLLKPYFLSIDRAFIFNKAVALAVRACVSRYIPAHCSIKWPNDILVDRKKVAGLLIEMSWQQDKCQHAIIGIGLNVNSPRAQHGADATSLAAELGRDLDLMGVFGALSSCLEEVFRSLEHNEIDYIASRYKMELFAKDEAIEFVLNGQSKRLIVRDVDNEGNIMLENEKGVNRFSHSEVKMVI